MKERLKFFLPVFYTLGAIAAGLLANAARSSVEGYSLEIGAILICYVALVLSVALWHLSEKLRSRLLSMITAGFSGMVLIFNIMPNLGLWRDGDFDVWGAKWHGALNSIVYYFSPKLPSAAGGDTYLTDDMLVLISSFCGICALVLVFSRAIAHTPAP